ncbi:MAG TPA: DNA gyrase subunit A [Bacteroidales bacterium]|jgi:DNA gyrase subunit A|nr:DNA gyrase subunit A [Bacteroidales bacterium]HNY52758.1 DNA gyrase subunit A [Bacteroidales bacterium]HOG57586.1 DNA gyrase subunit A [Bacteroidales bacterium]HPV16154.1 DNA gyrase subunit A [Bacteroidales bacterium]HPX43806.1 DNA gyrase subunit A [Bacteroidales bacterium]
MSDRERIIRVNIEEEMKSAYIDYSMSVIVSRALPDVRDGLKPVHRRVLFGMSELGVLSNRPFKKSARIVGEVLGKYHPHGDSSVYDAMVRMAQDWSLRYPLVEGQGNFGSVDGDSPAAMRYTEARLKKIAEETLSDIDKETVDFQLNFDDSLSEPVVLPTRIPILLVNGASGIAVGMATNMPPHNLTEIIDATIAFIDNGDISTSELMEYVKGPDFPTGGIIYGEQGIRDAFETGRGKIVLRARTEIELTHSGRECIIVNEIPYMVNKAEMIRKIADLINDKKLEGISYINDESDRNGMRVVIILKKDATSSVVLNNLFKYTAMQTSFNVNNVALVRGRPRTLNLKKLIDHFVKHRHEVVIRRSRYELNQAEKRAHILEGLIIASDNIDEVIAIIKSSKNPDEARERLMERFSLSEIQARAIVEMRLRQLTGLEQEKLRDEYKEIMALIEYLRSVLESVELQMKIIKDELIEIKEKYGDARRTEIVPDAGEFNPEDFYADDEMVITISNMGYIKRTPLTEFRRQNRGGTGSKGGTTREEDFIEHLYIATMHNTMLFFTKKGKCYWLKVYNIPEGSRTSKGRAMQNLINIEPDDSVMAYINVKNLNDHDYINNNFIVLCTRKGIIKKTSLEAYSRPRVNGVNAITVREGDELLEAKMTNGKHQIMMAVRSGRAIRFPEEAVRPMGRTASGVRGIRLEDEETDFVVGMITIENGSKEVLVVSENGYGKRSDIEDYRVTNRGGKGVKTINITEKTGSLIALKDVSDNDDLMIITQLGNILRSPVSALRVMGRATQGVRLINLRENDTIASVATVAVNDETEETDIEDVAGQDQNNEENGKEFED